MHFISRRRTNPGPLFSDIGRICPQFSGFSQHDAHELLLQLLSIVKKDEEVRQTHGLMATFILQNSPKMLPEEKRIRSERFLPSLKHTVIDAIFGGHFVNVIKCTQCHYMSVSFESFFNVSLSISKVNENKGSLSNCDHTSSEVPCAINQTVAKPTSDNRQKMTTKERKKLKAKKKAARREARIQSRKKASSCEQDFDSPNEEDELPSPSDVRDTDQQNSEKPVMNAQVIEFGDQIENDHNISSITTKPVPLVKPQNYNDGTSIAGDDCRRDFNKSITQKVSYDDDSHHDNLDLGTLLMDYTNEEFLLGDNLYLCPKCSKQNNNRKTYSEALRIQLFALPPPVLVVHLKRFSPITLQKVSRSVTFPMRLNLSPYTSRVYETLSSFYEPNMNLDKNESFLDYQLYGIVAHSGSVKGGHYTASVCVRPSKPHSPFTDKFVHLRPFIPDIDHVFNVYCEKACQRRKSVSSDGSISSKDIDRGNQINGSIPVKEVEDDVHTDDSVSKDDVEGGGEKEDSISEDGPSPMPGEWYQISDSCVVPISVDSVLRDTTKPYMLFYERIQ